MATTEPSAHPRAAWAPRVRALRSCDDRRDPTCRARGDLRHPGLRGEAAAAALRRPPRARREHLPLSARGVSGALRDERHARHALRVEAARAPHPDHDRGHELRGALGAGEGGARTRSHRGRDVDDDRGRRHDARGARALGDARLPASPVALRDESGRPPAGRRDRGRRRPGGEAGRRGHAARPQDLGPRRRDARPAEGDRPAERVAPPRLDGPGRPRDQAARAPRDHRLGEADLREGRRDPDVLRRAARGEGGRRRHRRRRDAGRDRGDAGRLHRARRHPDASGREARGRRAAGARHAPPGAARRLRRDPHGRRRREGPRARRGCRLDRRRRAHRPRRQRAGARGRVPRDRERRGLLRRLAGRVAIPRGSRRRTTRSQRASTPSSGDVAWRTTFASSRSRRRPSRGRAESRTSTTWSRRTSSR